jgi:hypothetical protein
MAEELYAKEAPLKDDRVKELAYTDAVYTQVMYSENAVTVDTNTLRNKTLDATLVTDVTLDQKLKLEDPDYTSVTLIKAGVGSPADYARVEAESALKVGTTDEEAAADIIKEKAILEKEEALDKDQKIKSYFADSFRLMVSTFRVKLLFDPEAGMVDKKAQEALDNKIEKKKQLIESVLDKFENTASFSDRLRKAKSDSIKELGLPILKTDAKYSAL